MNHPSLNVPERVSGISLVPMPIKGLGHDPELDDEIAGEVLGLGFAALLSPEAEQRIFIWPMMMRASEPPTKDRRSPFDPVNIDAFMAFSLGENSVCYEK